MWKRTLKELITDLLKPFQRQKPTQLEPAKIPLALPQGTPKDKHQRLGKRAARNIEIEETLLEIWRSGITSYRHLVKELRARTGIGTSYSTIAAFKRKMGII